MVIARTGARDLAAPKAHSHADLLLQLVHEIRSPLSVLMLTQDGAGDMSGSIAASRRIEQLLAYATSIVETAPLDVRRCAIWPEIEAAAAELACAGVFSARILSEGGQGGQAVLPSDTELRRLLLMGWLEAACYGASSSALVVSLHRGRRGDSLRAVSASSVSRLRAAVYRRVGVRACAALALRCGGRLVLSSGRPKAALLLPSLSSDQGGSLG